MTVIRHIARTAATLLTGVAVVTAVVAGIAMWAGYRPQPVLSGSMEPNLPIGSLTIAKAVPASSVGKGDIITFARPGASGTITHRIHAVEVQNGRRVYVTKGDANPTPDPWRVPVSGTIGRDVVDVPYVGYAAIWAAQPKVRGTAIGLATLLLIFGALRAIWRDRRAPAAAA